MGELGGMLAAAMLKVVAEQIGSAIGGQIKLQQDFTKDLEKMKMTLESVEAVLKDAERRSVTEESVRLWLKRLKDAMYAISDMIDEFEVDTQEFTQPSKRKFSLKKHLAVLIPCLPIGPKITLANKMKTMREDLDEITCQHRDFNLLVITNANELQVIDIRETSPIMEAQIFARTEEREKILASLFESMTKDITVLPIFGIGGIGKTTLARMVYNSSQFKDYSQTAGVYLEDVTLFTMHDLVHDLARSVMVDEILIAGKHGNTQGSRCHYALLNDCSTPLESSKIRALRFLDRGEIRLHDAAFSSAKSSLRVLDLSECSIHKLPNSIAQLKQLRYLNAPRIQDEMIPDSITGLSKLIYLNLRGSSSILALPDSIGEIEGLMYLDFSGCSAIKELTESLGGFKKLVHLNMLGCSGITKLPESLRGVEKLVCLNFSCCSGITELPESLGGLKKLVHLDLSNCSSVRDVSVFLGSLTELKFLNLSGCQYIEALPRSFKDLKNLVHLDLSNCHRLNGMPEALGGLTKLQYLNLSDTRDEWMRPYDTECRLRGLPEVIGNLTALRYLNLSGSMDSITRVINDGTFFSLSCRISTLSNLEHLNLSCNDHITIIPESFCKLRKLHTLHLSHCKFLKVIPESIGTIDSLKFLYFNYCFSLSEPPQLSSSSLSLPHFMVHAGDGDSGSNLVLLQHTNPVVLQVTRLENVKFVEEAPSIKLMEKQSLEKLKLEWTRDAERFVDDKILLEKLVPPSTLKELEIQGYNGVSFPVWVMGQLPNLKLLVVREMEE